MVLHRPIECTGFIGIHSALRGWQAGWIMGLQWKVSAIFWALCTLICASMLKGKPLHSLQGNQQDPGFLGKRYSAWGIRFNLDQLVGTVLVAIFFGIGVTQDLAVARA